MSKYKSNMNPDYYKTAGSRAMQDRDVSTISREQYAESLASKNTAAPPREKNQQTSAKTGKRSSGQKLSSTRHAENPAPSAKHVSGAFGREGRGNQKRSRRASQPNG